MLETPPTTPGDTAIELPETAGDVGTANLATLKSSDRVTERSTPSALMAVTVTTLLPTPAAEKSSLLSV